MSAWRREAIKHLPEYLAIIEDAENPMALWIELHFKCDDAYENQPNEELINRFFHYARWCSNCPDMDVKTAVVICFYENLPRNPRARADLPRRFSLEEFKMLRDVFAYHFEPDQFASFERDFIDAKKRWYKGN